MELQNKHVTERIISAAIRVHKELGPGFLEAMYEEALAIELAAAGLTFKRQKLLPVFYREHLIGEHRLDFLVEGKVIVELKAISALDDIHFAIVRSYLKAANLEDALLLNFATARLTVKRVGREYHPTTKREDLVL
ncbi:MAG: GxxExxY protein [Verrucomicrobia bacterium]|nr:MAG: GxxExxY protein [Verrucomicrobiota bacterium]